ncbi:TatD family hydrolase [Xanthocytophaga flava]|uniref:TatD family hydrolase n=1 Tax=Xanthocytophaga flava TaxID=3048013 RepID=UPI0028D682C3|nr:TatD family hydrolase [Xanthocytophaga flavus]MDJ1472423.1 TatD family hydrolase [Xanthocytophaga flavus]
MPNLHHNVQKNEVTMPYPFVNFHTHSSRQRDEIAFRNVRASERNSLSQTNEYISVGIHPWDVHLPDLDEQWHYVEKQAKQPSALLIGEAGLDRNAQATIETQMEIFTKHISLAEHLQKPLVIHCVRAFPELIQLKKQKQSTVTWIVHGYNANLTIATQLLDHGFYFSLGSALLHTTSNAGQLLKVIPPDRFFLETDDKYITIEEIYQMASSILNNSIETLTKDIFTRVLNLFPAIAHTYTSSQK